MHLEQGAAHARLDRQGLDGISVAPHPTLGEPDLVAHARKVGAAQGQDGALQGGAANDRFGRVLDAVDGLDARHVVGVQGAPGSAVARRRGEHGRQGIGGVSQTQ